LETFLPALSWYWVQDWVLVDMMQEWSGIEAGMR
jgi:hypothetical protein